MAAISGPSGQEPPPFAAPSHQSFDVEQKPQQGQQYPPQPYPQQYPPNQQPYPQQYPPNQQPYPQQYPPNQQPYPQQYPPNQQPYPQQYPPNQQPYPQNNQNQAREMESLALGIIVMVCCFPFSLCCIPCLFPNACGDSRKVLCFPFSLCCIPCLFPNACGDSSPPQ